MTLPFVLNLTFAHSVFGKHQYVYQCRHLPSGVRQLGAHVLVHLHGLGTMVASINMVVVVFSLGFALNA